MADKVEEPDLVCQIEHEKDRQGLTIWVYHSFKNDMDATLKTCGEQVLQLIKDGVNPKSLRILSNHKVIFYTTWSIKKAE